MLNYIKIENFRNLLMQKVSLQDRHIVLCGDNGQGKTSFIEAIYYLIFSSSFREQKEDAICQIGQDAFVLFGEFTQENQSYQDKLGVSWAKKHKRIIFNGRELRDRKELVAQFPCIPFLYDDLLLIDGTMERRRRFFDQILSLINPTFIDYLRQYKKILKERNLSLRTRQLDLLPIYTQQLIKMGLILVQERQKMIKLFKSLFSPLMKEVAGLEILIEYQPHWKILDEDHILKIFDQKKDQELKQGLTLHGPHRDRYTFIYQENDAEHYLSLGQKRLLALSLKTSATQLFYQQSQRKPILLLDDIFLELTHDLRAQFLSYLPPYDQAFFTFLTQEYAHIPVSSPLIYQVKNGKLIEP
ncbi:MAG: DNA replication/repair protein RecF [Spirochaetia bacterium]